MSVQASTHYDLLGVSPGARHDSVRSAYRRLAQRYHPDKMPGNPRAQQVMAALNEAYTVLSDPHQRAEYDEFVRTSDLARLAEEQRAYESFRERLDDQGAAWPWYLLFATITFCAAVVGVTIYFNYVPGASAAITTSASK
jgi:curved DNA-binding protein CbpA